MKIVIAPDSFKESLTAVEVADIVAGAFKRAMPECEVVTFPLADGGEGTCSALVASLGGQMISEEVLDCLGQPMRAHWGRLPSQSERGDIAVIEFAAASGLESIPLAARNPLQASSYGTGQLIRRALDAGVQDFIIGLGGSATNDAGAGLLNALGMQFLNQAGEPVPLGAAYLSDVKVIRVEDFDPRVSTARFRVASDVNNPLLGSSGATAVYGPQKGVTPSRVPKLDAALASFATVSEALTGTVHRHAPGAGAAGGAGFALMQYFPVAFYSGIELMLSILEFDSQLENADLVITGEGSLDEQSFHGKVPVGVALRAQQKGVPAIALCGSLSGRLEKLNEVGIAACFSIVPGSCTLAEALDNAAQNLDQCAYNVAQVLAINLPTNRPKA